MTYINMYSSRLGAAALLTGPILMLVADRVQPRFDWDDPATVLEVIAAKPRMFTLALVLYFCGGLLLLAGLITAATTLGRRRPLLGMAALIVAPLAPLSIMLASSTGLTVDHALARSVEDRLLMAEVLAQTHASVWSGVIFLSEMIGLIGILMLGFALWRAGTVRVWMPLALLAGFAILFSGSDGSVQTLVGNTLIAVAFGLAAVGVVHSERIASQIP